MRPFVCAAWLFLLFSGSALANDIIFAPAQPDIEIGPGHAGAGVRVSDGACPCIRFVVRTHKLGGRIETRKFIISTDAFFRFELALAPRSNVIVPASRYFNIGALEAIMRGSRVGLGFAGVTIGHDNDLSYSEITRTGLYVFMQLLRSEALSFDIRSGYEYEQKRVNLSPLVRSNDLVQSAVLSFEYGFLAGQLGAVAAFDPRVYSDLGGYRLGANASLEASTVLFKSVDLAFGVEALVEHDPFREQFGLDPNQRMVGVYIDASYIPRRLRKERFHAQ